VTGTIGDAALGLQLRLHPQRFERLDMAARNHLLGRYLAPEPRLALAPALRQFAHAGMDISDGLVGDLVKMAKVSGVSAQIQLADIPLSEAARREIALDAGLFETALTGGDDYELIVGVEAQQCGAFEAAARSCGIALTRIGTATSDAAAPVFLDASGRPVRFAQTSFSHF
jgi:thiamine-monophosphate kinase